MWYLKGCFVKILFFHQLSCFGVKPPKLDTFIFLLHIKKLSESSFYMTGNFAFPCRHACFECFKEKIFFSSFSQFLICFRSIWKLLAVWLMFFPFLIYQLATFSLKHQINFLYLKLNNKHSNSNKEPSNGSLQHSKGSNEHSKGNLKLKQKKKKKNGACQNNNGMFICRGAYTRSNTVQHAIVEEGTLE